MLSRAKAANHQPGGKNMKAITRKIAATTVAVLATVIMASAGLLIKPQGNLIEQSSLAGVAACYQMCPQ